MVNMPMGLSSFPSKVNDSSNAATDVNHNINPEYYKWLLKQHNYFPESICVQVRSNPVEFNHNRCVFVLFTFVVACEENPPPPMKTNVESKKKDSNEDVNRHSDACCSTPCNYVRCIYKDYIQRKMNICYLHSLCVAHMCNTCISLYKPCTCNEK